MPLHDVSAGAHDEQDDGWIADDNEVWTWASTGPPDTFTVSGDQTGRYTPGTRIKLTQSATVKYFVVSSVSFAAPTTTVTITGGSDYSLANAAISANFHSYMANPQGYPGWFNWAAATTGFSSFSSGPNTRFSVVGRQCTLEMYLEGTSNATTMTQMAPIAAGPGIASFAGGAQAIGRVENNGTWGTGLFAIASGSTTINYFKDVTTASFTASSTKGIAGQFSYEI